MDLRHTANASVLERMSSFHHALHATCAAHLGGGTAETTPVGPNGRLTSALHVAISERMYVWMDIIFRDGVARPERH